MCASSKHIRETPREPLDPSQRAVNHALRVHSETRSEAVAFGHYLPNTDP